MNPAAHADPTCRLGTSRSQPFSLKSKKTLPRQGSAGHALRHLLSETFTDARKYKCGQRPKSRMEKAKQGKRLQHESGGVIEEVLVFSGCR